MEAESFHVDELTDYQIDMTKLIVALRKFANVSKKYEVQEYYTRGADKSLTRPGKKTSF